MQRFARVGPADRSVARAAESLHRADQPLDLPPAAEAGHVAPRAALLGAFGGVKPGPHAEPVDQRQRLGSGGAIDHEAIGRRSRAGGVEKFDLHHPALAGQSGDPMKRIGKRSASHVALARPARSWQGRGMDSAPPPRRKPIGGGVFIAIGLVTGAIAGGLLGQPSIGLLAGLAAGGTVTALLWWRDR